MWSPSNLSWPCSSCLPGAQKKGHLIGSTSSGSLSAGPLEDAPSMEAVCKAEALESVEALEGSLCAFKSLSLEFQAHLNWKGKAG